MDIFCESGYSLLIHAKCHIMTIFSLAVGVFMREPSVRHCITVRNAVARTVNERNKYDAK